MLLLNGACVLTIQICVFCAAAFAEAGDAGARRETGQWGEWGDWSTCSAECSTGITVRSRRCQHPHMLPVASLLSKADDSVHCAGSEKEIKLCNKQACGEGRGGWREEECAKYDTSVHGGRRYTWQPFIHPSEPCKLTCRAKGHHFYSNLADRVVDGTPCAGTTANPTAVCLQGQCQELGCDDVVGSPWRPDMCGVCKGDNSTCRKISGIFTRQDLKRGLNQIAVIPAGSTRIRVKGLRYSSNWIALQTADGDYVLNGGQKRSAGTVLEVAGTVFNYRTKRRCAGQCLVAKGPTTQTLKLMLNTRGRNRGVMYSFNIPLNVSNSYLRRIINTARSRADLIRNASSPHHARRIHNHHRRHHGHVGNSNYFHSNNRSSTTATTTTTSTTAATSTTTARKENKNMNDNDDQVESVESADEDAYSEEIEDENNPENDDLSDVLEESADSDSTPDEGQSNDKADAELALNSDSHEEAAALESPEDKEPERRTKITHKEKPRFIDAHAPSKDSFANKNRNFEFRSNAQDAESDSQMDDSQHVNADHSYAESESEDDVDEADILASEELLEADRPAEEDNEDESEISDPQSDQQPDDSAEDAGRLGRPQSDGPRQQYFTSYRTRSGRNGQRTWRRFRRPNFSQSFTFRGRHRQGKDGRERSRSRPSRPAHIDHSRVSSRRQIRYRQQPQSQVSQSGRPASVSAYGQSSGRIPSYSGSSAQVHSRQYLSSQRQALRGRQSVSPNQNGLQPGIENRQPPLRSSANIPHPSQRGSNQEQDKAGQQQIDEQEEYKRQLQRRRQLIEQQIAAQNAEYQRRLEERNQRLRREHLERQRQRYRHRHRNDSHVGHQEVKDPRGHDNEERQSVSQDRNQGSPENERIKSPPRGQPEQSASAQRNVNFPQTPSPPSPSNPGGNFGAGDRGRPLLISNRRPTHQQETKPPAPRPSQPEENPRQSGNNERGSESNIFPQRSRNIYSTPSPVPSGVNNIPESVDGQRPLIISNRRPVLQPEKGSPPSSASEPAGPPTSSVDAASGASPVLPPDSRQRIVNSRLTPSGLNNLDSSPDSNNRKWPLFISNRRPEPGTPPGSIGSRPAVATPEAESGALLPEGRTSQYGFGPSRVAGASQSNVASQARQPVSSSVPDILPSQARPPANAAVPGVSPNQPRQPVNPSLPNLIPNQARPSVNPPTPDVIPNQARPPVNTGAPGVSPDEARQPGAPGVSPNEARQPVNPSVPDLIPNQAWQPANRSVPGISPSLASMGGGFVPPQYIPENTRGYSGRSELSASSPNELPTGGESPLVIGAEGNAILKAVESGVANGGEGNVLAIDEAGDQSSYVWRVSGLTECTLTCGGGVQQTVVVCLDTRTQAFVTDDNCVHVQRPETKALTCNTRPCPAQWQPGQWSPCSVSCGPGQQTRSVQCLARVSPTLNVTMADENCQAAEKPELRQECQNVACNSWKVGNWSQCSVQCGEGMRTRDVYCTDQTGFDVSDDLCEASGSKPNQEEACVVEPCGKGWYYTDWPEKCPVRCGAGTMKRGVACLGDGGAPLPESSCNMTSRPLKQQDCTADSPCGGQWFAGEWSQCNVTCGSGYQDRDVICMKGMAEGLLSMMGEENCAAEEKPTLRQPCEMDPCLAEWYMTAWTECSQTCGRGHRTREVKCLDPQRHPSSQCPAAGKPDSREACNMASCVTTPPPAPVVSECRDTFSRCQLVKHARMCRFSFYKKKCCATCTGDT